jgi:hypothetical protein
LKTNVAENLAELYNTIQLVFKKTLLITLIDFVCLFDKHIFNAHCISTCYLAFFNCFACMHELTIGEDQIEKNLQGSSILRRMHKDKK